MSTATEPSVYFGERAQSYDREYERADLYGYALHSRMAAVLRLLGPPKGEVLDAGMGPGRLCRELADRGWAVSGVDGATEMVAAARERVPEAAPRLVCGDVEALPFQPGAFDAVVATGVLEYVDVGTALAEFVRVLKPGGRGVFSYPNRDAVYGRWKTQVLYPTVRVVKRVLRRPPLLLAVSPPTIARDELPKLIAASGLRLEAIEYASFAAILSPLDAFVPRLTVALGRRLERHGRRLAGPFATQVVYSARKP